LLLKYYNDFTMFDESPIEIGNNDKIKLLLEQYNVNYQVIIMIRKK
jgi:hypothetical protein